MRIVFSFFRRVKIKMTDLEEKLTQENNDLRRQLSKFYSIDVQDFIGPYFGISARYEKRVLDNDFAVKHILREMVGKMYDIREKR